MTDIFIFLLAVATAAGIAGYQERKKKAEGTPSAPQDDKGAQVFEILRLAHLDIRRQKVAGIGPWLSAVLDHRCTDPAVALTAIRWTIRDLQKQPVGEGTGYISGLPFRFDLTGLERAEKELEGMIGKRK